MEKTYRIDSKVWTLTINGIKPVKKPFRVVAVRNTVYGQRYDVSDRFDGAVVVNNLFAYQLSDR